MNGRVDRRRRRSVEQPITQRGERRPGVEQGRHRGHTRPSCSCPSHLLVLASVDRQARGLRDRRRRRLRPHRDLRLLMMLESALHPDPLRADDAVRRLQRQRGHVPLWPRSSSRASSRTSSAPGSPTRSATSAASSCSRGTARSCTSSPRTSSGPTAGSRSTAPRPSSSPDAADHPHLHLAPGRRRAMPFWRFTAAYTFLGCIPWMLTLVRSAAGRRQLGGLEGLPALRRLRRSS